MKPIEKKALWESAATQEDYYKGEEMNKTKFKYTPWKVVDHTRDGRLHVNDKYNTIAEVYGFSGTVKANAAIIAAAPTMLELLINIADDLEHSRLKHIDGTDEALEEVRQVIAKAEGR